MVVWKSGIGIRACSFWFRNITGIAAELPLLTCLPANIHNRMETAKGKRGEMWEVGGFWGFNQGKKPGLQGGTLHKVYYRVLVIVFTRDFKAGIYWE